MRRAQKAMVDFLPLIDWPRFRRRELGAEVRATHFHRFACGDERQALVWLLRRRAIGADGRVRADVDPVAPEVAVPGLGDGTYRVTGWDTAAGRATEELTATAAGGRLRFTPAPIGPDRAFAIRRLP